MPLIITYVKSLYKRKFEISNIPELVIF